VDMCSPYLKIGCTPPMRGDVKASAPAQKGKLVARRGRKATGLELKSQPGCRRVTNRHRTGIVWGSGGIGRESKEGF